jgi:hypothetical protein
MTEQIRDSVRFRSAGYSMIWARGSGLFHPAQVDITPVEMSTACYRGFICHYEISDDTLLLTGLVVLGTCASYPSIGGVVPRIERGFGTLVSAAIEADIPGFTFRAADSSFGPAIYREMRLPVPFDGGIILGRENLFPHLRGCNPYNWQEIFECLFTGGRLDRAVDCSGLFGRMREAVRQQVAEAYKIPSKELILRFGYGSRSQEIASQAILDRLRPNHWGEDLSWAYETVRALENTSSLVEDNLQALEDIDRAFREQQRERDEQAAEGERTAREFFARIERDGWNCTHCGWVGVADEDFRFSIGPMSCVICRKCGWVQDLLPEP